MTTPQLYTTVALCIYTAIMILIGCISYGKSKTLDGFLIGGRNIGAWATAFAYGTTYFSAVVFVGYAGQHGWNIGLGAVCLLYQFEYQALLKQVTYDVVDAFFQVSFVCHSLFDFNCYLSTVSASATWRLQSIP